MELIIILKLIFFSLFVKTDLFHLQTDSFLAVC